MNNLAEQIKKEKERLKSLCPFQKDQILEWTEKDKNGQDVTKRGVFDYYYVSDDLSTAMKINLPVHHNINYSSSYAYFKDVDFSKFIVIKNPYDEYKGIRIDDMIDTKEYEIQKATEILNSQLKRLQRIKEKEQNKCVHKWKKLGGSFASPVRTNIDFLGQSRVS